MELKDVKQKDDVYKHLQYIAEKSVSVPEFYARARALMQHCDSLGIEWPDVCEGFKAIAKHQEVKGDKTRAG